MVLNKEEVKEIPDIRVRVTDDPNNYEGFYIFTDGCGNVSNAIANEINKKHKLSHCSAYQIRLGGTKGVLMLKPSLEGRCVEVRPS